MNHARHPEEGVTPQTGRRSENTGSVSQGGVREGSVGGTPELHDALAHRHKGPRARACITRVTVSGGHVALGFSCLYTGMCESVFIYKYMSVRNLYVNNHPNVGIYAVLDRFATSNVSLTPLFTPPHCVVKEIHPNLVVVMVVRMNNCSIVIFDHLLFICCLFSFVQ